MIWSIIPLRESAKISQLYSVTIINVFNVEMTQNFSAMFYCICSAKFSAFVAFSPVRPVPLQTHRTAWQCVIV